MAGLGLVGIRDAPNTFFAGASQFGKPVVPTHRPRRACHNLAPPRRARHCGGGGGAETTTFPAQSTMAPLGVWYV